MVLDLVDITHRTTQDSIVHVLTAMVRENMGEGLLLTTASGLQQGLVYLFWLFPFLRCSITVFLSGFFGNGAFLLTKLLQTGTLGSSGDICILYFSRLSSNPWGLVSVPLPGKLHSSEPPCNADIVKNCHFLGFSCFLFSEVIGFEAGSCNN